MGFKARKPRPQKARPPTHYYALDSATGEGRLVTPDEAKVIAAVVPTVQLVGFWL